MERIPPNKMPYTRRMTLTGVPQADPARVFRLDNAAVFPGWSPKAIHELEGSLLSILRNHDHLLGESLITICLSPSVRTDKTLFEFNEKGDAYSVHLCGRPVENAEQLIFTLTRQIALRTAPERLHKLVFYRAERRSETAIRELLRSAVGQLPRCFDAKLSLELIGKKARSNQEMIDLYKLIYALIEPAPLPAGAVGAVAAGVVEGIYNLVTEGQIERQLSPWELLCRLAAFSVIAERLEKPAVKARCLEILQDNEFGHHLLMSEMEDRDLPFSQGRSLSPDEDARQRYLLLFDAFYRAAGKYYDLTSIPY